MWFITLFTLISWAQSDLPDTVNLPMPQTHRSILTHSGPGKGSIPKWTLCLWVSGGGKRETVFNWGAYDSSQDNFLLRFFMGDAGTIGNDESTVH